MLVIGVILTSLKRGGFLVKKIDLTPYLEDIKRMWVYENKTLSYISKELGFSVKTIHKPIKENSWFRCFRDKKWLEKKHYGERKNTVEMAEEANCAVDSIRDWMNHYNIPVSMEIANDSKRKYALNHDYFKKIDTEEKAYWLGFLAADGYVSREGGVVIVVLSEKDIDHLKKFTKAIETNTPIIQYKQKFDSKREKEYNMCKIAISSIRFHDNIVDKGITPIKMMDKRIPDIEERWYKHFIRGYYDGDGSISFVKRKKVREWKSQTTHTSTLEGSVRIVGTFKLLNWIVDVSEPFVGRKSKISEKKTIFSISASDGTMIKLLNWLYSNSTVFLSRKYGKYQEYLHLYNTRSEWESKDIVRTSERPEELSRNDLAAIEKTNSSNKIAENRKDSPY